MGIWLYNNSGRPALPPAASRVPSPGTSGAGPGACPRPPLLLQSPTTDQQRRRVRAPWYYVYCPARTVHTARACPVGRRRLPSSTADPGATGTGDGVAGSHHSCGITDPHSPVSQILRLPSFFTLTAIWLTHAVGSSTFSRTPWSTSRFSSSSSLGRTEMGTLRQWRI